MSRHSEPSATVWLDDPESQAWRALAGVLTRLPGALNAQLMRDSQITHFEYMVMAALSEAPDRTLRMTDLATRTAGALPRLSQVAGRLEQRGWLTRRPDTIDRRSSLATLTDDGVAVVVAAAPGHVAEVRRLVLDPLTTAQVGQLGRIASRIVSTVDPTDSRASVH